MTEIASDVSPARITPPGCCGQSVWSFAEIIYVVKTEKESAMESTQRFDVENLKNA